MNEEATSKLVGGEKLQGENKKKILLRTNPFRIDFS